MYWHCVTDGAFCSGEDSLPNDNHLIPLTLTTLFFNQFIISSEFDRFFLRTSRK